MFSCKTDPVKVTVFLPARRASAMERKDSDPTEAVTVAVSALAPASTSSTRTVVGSAATSPYMVMRAGTKSTGASLTGVTVTVTLAGSEARPWSSTSTY
eukprot:239424-Pyramimonas_sp.AAC.1